MIRLKALAALLVSAAVLLAANGLQGTLIAVRGNLEGWSPAVIGALGSAYFLGFMAASFLAPRLIGRAGHVRAFATLAGLAAAVALVFALVVDPWVWAALRFASGFCFAGMAMVVESWLNARTRKADRGRVLAVYRIVDLGAVTAGQFLLTLGDPAGAAVFSVMAILYSLSLVPVSSSRIHAPRPGPAPRLDPKKLFAVSPLAAVTVFAVALANGTFRTLGPVYAQAGGFDTAGVAAMVSAFIVGGALFQWPFGAASDRFGRRWAILAATAGAALSAGLLAGGTTLPVWLLFGAVGLFGACALPLYSLAIAHANDFCAPRDYVEVSSGLLLVYSVGAIIGPALGSVFMALLGPGGLFAYIGLVHAALLAFGLVRTAIGRRPQEAAERARFVPFPRTSAALFRLARRDRD